MAEICQLILSNNTVNWNEIDGKSALFYAAGNNIPRVITKLKDKGFDLNVVDGDKKTAMFYANQNYNMDALCELIFCGAEYKLDEIDGKAVFFHAAKNSFIAVIMDLCVAGLDPYITDDDGNTVLYYANQDHNMEVICNLICLDDEFDLDEFDGKAVLFYAVNNQSDLSGVVQALHDAGFDLNTTDDQGNTALFYANQKHCMDALCALISCGAEFNLNQIDGKAILFHAAANNFQGVIKPLYNAGLDLNMADDEGHSASFHANQNYSLPVLYELIQLGAELDWTETDYDKNAMLRILESLSSVDLQVCSDALKHIDIDREGKNALYQLICLLIRSVPEFSLDKIDGKAILFYVTKYDESDDQFDDIVGLLHDAGLDLNITDDEGKTALFYASQNHNMHRICELIDNGAEFDPNEIDGKSVLFYAVKNDFTELVEVLHGAGLDLNVTDEDGNTAVFYASQNHNLNALCELIRYGAKFKLEEIDGQSILFFSAKHNYFEVVKALYDEGLDLNITDNEGKTALFYANQSHNMDTLCELIRCNVELNMDEFNSKGAFFYAARYSLPNVVMPLKNAGLDLNVTDDEGKTVVFYADKDFLEVLIAAVDEVLINARDRYGRTPLFYALQHNNSERARYLIEKGGNLKVKDNCNLSAFSFFAQHCVSNDVKALERFTSELFQDEQQRKSLAFAILDIVHCLAPLLSVSDSPHLSTLYPNFDKVNILAALNFGRKFLDQDLRTVDSLDNIVSMIKDDVDVPHFLSFLNKLGVNPDAVDSRGNTAVHYATLLPLFGITQEAAVGICKKLREVGASFVSNNQRGESPLVFSLSTIAWITRDNNLRSSIEGFTEVWKFLLNSTNSLQNVNSIFHEIILNIGNALEVNTGTSTISQVLMDCLTLLPPKKEAIRNAVNDTDVELNSPLHYWASIALTSPQDYQCSATGDHRFASMLQMTLDHLVQCGAKLNSRNANEQTPLHECRTWTAVKMLLDAGANPTDLDSSGHSPLLAAAKMNKSPKKTGYFFPDVTEDPKTFWGSALKKGLDLWRADENGESLLSILIKAADFSLAKALIEVSCTENNATDNARKLFLLNTVCKDESKNTRWKTNLVEIILRSARRSQLVLDLPLRFCCQNILKFGMTDEKPNCSRKEPNEAPCNDNDQAPPKKKRKNEPVKEEQVSYDSVHCEIAKQLLSYGVDVHASDSSGKSCLDIAKGCPSLQDLLQKPVEIDTIACRIPWNSVSSKWKCSLGKVVRRQEYSVVDQIWYHKDHIGTGSFSHVFAGINAQDGREVAIKRIEKLRMQRPEDKREIKSLTALADCEQIVRYISFFEDENFSYVVLELMEGNLDEYLKEPTIDATEAAFLCQHVVMGVQFLHQQNILHRDLKPQNILYKVHPKMCLKIADFGLSRTTHKDSTTVYGSLAGTRCWIAPEVWTSTEKNVATFHFRPPSDMFACGILLHYTLSGRKHPFSPTDCASKNEVQVSYETEGNIMKGKMEGWNCSLSSEATDLIKKMLDHNENDRLNAKEALQHPFFWSKEKKVDFLQVVGNETEIQCPRSKRTTLTEVEKDLERSCPIIVKHKWWNSRSYKYMPVLYNVMTKWRRYETWSVVELLRFIRNVYQHYKDNTFRTPVPIGEMLFKDFVFLDYFPDLAMEVYKSVTVHGWDKTRPDIKCFINKKNY